MRIVLGISAGIAAYKSVQLVRLLREEGHRVDVIPTPAAEQFVGRATWEAISGREVTTSVFEGVDQVRHVRLGQEADLIVVAPATADLLARARAGMADDLLTSTLLASEAPTLVVPAMHTEMWRSPATAENVAVLRRRGVEVMEPGVGRLTGKDSGPGRMPEPEQIFARIRELLDAGPAGPAERTRTAAEQGTEAPLAGRRVVVTAGGTREPLDPVRYLGNRSSGKQGIALALAAAQAGAEVHLIGGIVDVPAPQHPAITVERLQTATELQDAVERAVFGTHRAGSRGAGRDDAGSDDAGSDGAEWAGADLLLMAAAVADFRPADYAEAKIKKSDDGENPVITLERNPDILAETVRRRDAEAHPAIIVGFAAETGGDGSEEPLQLAQTKLTRKGCELLVLNRVGTDLVFGQDETEVHILASERARRRLADAEPVSVAGTKEDAAAAVIGRAAELLARSAPHRVIPGPHDAES